MVDVDRFPFLTLALSRMHFNRSDAASGCICNSSSAVKHGFLTCSWAQVVMATSNRAVTRYSKRRFPFKWNTEESIHMALSNITTAMELIRCTPVSWSVYRIIFIQAVRHSQSVLVLSDYCLQLPGRLDTSLTVAHAFVDIIPPLVLPRLPMSSTSTSTPTPRCHGAKQAFAISCSYS